MYSSVCLFVCPVSCILVCVFVCVQVPPQGVSRLLVLATTSISHFLEDLQLTQAFNVTLHVSQLQSQHEVQVGNDIKRSTAIVILEGCHFFPDVFVIFLNIKFSYAYEMLYKNFPGILSHIVCHRITHLTASHHPLHCVISYCIAKGGLGGILVSARLGSDAVGQLCGQANRGQTASDGTSLNIVYGMVVASAVVAANAALLFLASVTIAMAIAVAVAHCWLLCIFTCA